MHSPNSRKRRKQACSKYPAPAGQGKRRWPFTGESRSRQGSIAPWLHPVATTTGYHSHRRGHTRHSSSVAKLERSPSWGGAAPHLVQTESQFHPHLHPCSGPTLGEAHPTLGGAHPTGAAHTSLLGPRPLEVAASLLWPRLLRHHSHPGMPLPLCHVLQLFPPAISCVILKPMTCPLPTTHTQGTAHCCAVLPCMPTALLCTTYQAHSEPPPYTLPRHQQPHACRQQVPRDRGWP